MKNVLRLWWLLLAVFAVPVSWAAPQSNDFYVFGDSLSDTGNDLVLTRLQGINPPIPPSESPHRTYFKGRFSNGPVAVEYLRRLLQGDNNAVLTPFLSKKGLTLDGGISFAFGGSMSGYISQTPGGFYVPGVLGQIELFRKALLGKRVKAGALITIWTGANDYLLDETPPQPNEVVANITQSIKSLYSMGARNFLIPNLPDMGLTPIIQEKELGAEFQLLTESHNALLVQAMNELAPRLGGIKIIVVDLFTVTQNLLTEEKIIATLPALEHIAPGTGAVSCLVVNPATCPDVDVTGGIPPFAFWDVLHPTTLVHSFYGQAMFNSLKSTK